LLSVWLSIFHVYVEAETPRVPFPAFFSTVETKIVPVMTPVFVPTRGEWYNGLLLCFGIWSSFE
jgi:hypothetical protein